MEIGKVRLSLQVPEELNRILETMATEMGGIKARRKNNRCKSPSPACGRGRDPRQREGEGSSRRKVEGDFVSSLARPYPHPARLTLATFSRKREKGWTLGPCCSDYFYASPKLDFIDFIGRKRRRLRCGPMLGGEY
jgi:hypothetical protein